MNNILPLNGINNFKYPGAYNLPFTQGINAIPQNYQVATPGI